ncbi:MAG: sigma-E factor negative regulatory protein [Pseudomonadota bacterium]
MDTHKKIREHISSLCDGELPDCDLELALAALQSADGQHAWSTYHRIGDALRAQATPELSDGFGARLAARLAGEPAPGKRAGRGAAAAINSVAGRDEPAEPVAAKAKPAVVSVS